MSARSGAGTGLRSAGWLGALTPSGRARVPVAWSLYDFANTIFSYAVVSYAISLWITADTRLGAGGGQLALGIAVAASVLLNALVSPVLGAISDRGGRRLPYLFVFTALCVLPTAFIGAAPPLVGLALFALANFSYQAALIYYDATLPSVSLADGRGRLSGLGVSIGYLGTIFVALMILILQIPVEGVFLLAAVLFALFALPIFAVVREPRTGEHRFSFGEAARSWSQLRTTFRRAGDVPGLRRFLVARFFYTDPVNTVIIVMGVYAREAIGLTNAQVNMVLLLLTVVAVIASVGWGRLVDRIGPKRTLLIVLVSWCVGLGIAGLVVVLPTFLIAGAILGSGLGGVNVSDRVLMLRLAPQDRVGEFFGLYGLVGKLSAVMGPLLYGLVVGLLYEPLGTVAYQIGILGLFGFMVVGIVLLRPVSDRWGEPSGEAA
jgi:UMF1 family MFS transporter